VESVIENLGNSGCEISLPETGFAFSFELECLSLETQIYLLEIGNDSR
jgi:hypothetical protein